MIYTILVLAGTYVASGFFSELLKQKGLLESDSAATILSAGPLTAIVLVITHFTIPLRSLNTGEPIVGDSVYAFIAAASILVFSFALGVIIECRSRRKKKAIKRSPNERRRSDSLIDLTLIRDS